MQAKNYEMTDRQKKLEKLKILDKELENIIDSMTHERFFSALSIIFAAKKIKQPDNSGVYNYVCEAILKAWKACYNLKI
jgi:hypothetical protein